LGSIGIFNAQVQQSPLLDGCAALWYPGTMKMIERVQTGVRIERRMVKVLKGLAEHSGISLGDLLEGIVLHAFEGKCAFTAPSLEVISKLKAVYGLDLTSEDAHTFVDDGSDSFNA